MTGRTPTTIVTADAIVCAGLTYALRHQHDILLVGDDGWLPDHLRAPHVAVVAGEVIDAELLRLIRTHSRVEHRKVVIVVNNLDTRSLFSGLEAGASGFLRRSQATAGELVRAIVAASKGDGSIPPEMLPDVLENLGRLQRQVLAPRGLSFAPLNDREIAVLRLLSEGCGVAEISRTLSFSERTIKNVVHDVTVRLGLRNRTHAVAYAVREGLI